MLIKTLSLTVALIIGGIVTGLAQNKTNYGIKVGLNLSTISTSSKYFEHGLKPDFMIGGFAETNISQKVSFQPGLYYARKGWKHELAGFKEKARFNYIHAPLNFLYNLSNGKGKFFIGGGPYVAVALGGQLHSDGGNVLYDSSVMEAYTSKIKIGKGETAMDAADYRITRIDYGITALTGYQFKNGLLFSVNYDLGLANISTYDAYKERNRVTSISVGYAF